MNKILSVNFLTRKTPSTLLGLSLDGSRLEGVVLRRQNGSLHVLQRFTTALALDPLTAEVELAGREILNHLQAAGVRERDCVVALPLRWALVAHTEIPKLPEADIPAFLDIEAERGFPTDIATLQLATSRMSTPGGQSHATFIGLPRAQVERLEQVLRSAKLRPLSFTFGLTALHAHLPSSTSGVLALQIEETHVGLVVATGGGIAAIRALESTLEDGNGGRVLHGDLIAREARITLGQLPDEVRDAVKSIRIYGPRDSARKLADEIRPRFESAGLKVEAVAVYPSGAFGKTLPPDTTVSSAFNVAANHVVQGDRTFEFLPPHISAWQKATSKYAPGKLRKIAAVAILLLLAVGVAFGYQHYQLSALRTEWNAMSPRVRTLEGVNDNIHQYRGWFDPNFRCLNILKQLTLAFPEDGSVTARTLEIRDLAVVTCSGTAENNMALVRTTRQLRTNSAASDITPQLRGSSPIQFTFEYRLNRPANETR